MGLPIQAERPSPIVWRAVRSAAIEDRDSVRTINPRRDWVVGFSITGF